MKSSDGSKTDVFTQERQTLRKAKENLDSQSDPAAREQQYRALVADYEKLLKTTTKISKISDILGKMLKEKELEIRVANENLRKAEGLRRQLIQDISHELGTPMTTVQGYVEALIDGVVEPEPRYFRMIHNRLVSLNRLISDLFHLTTLRANEITFHFKKIAWQPWIQSILGKYVMDASQKGIQLHTHIVYHRYTSAVLHIDPIRVDQVLGNFIHNALKFTPEGGSVSIHCETMSIHEARERFISSISSMDQSFFFGQSQYVASIQVTDTGTGILEEELPYLFDRFYRGKQPKQRKEQGAGLGLAISKEIIKRHGGEIGAFGQAGKGSTFFFLLPCECAAE